MKLKNYIQLILMQTPNDIDISFDICIDETLSVRDHAGNHITFTVHKYERELTDQAIFERMNDEQS